ncbi:hypothetical protein H2200_002566 [Cladophialophora chaetospira]|uniref:DUF2235 domain-containing protein n=1 Tax=Cladophialophora chaetospira TaxID=386627 RepID=A0AA38XJ40_9EURO|nr:hypothetical protein H2200_002566 [Cladophialophora chaetospira]
MASSLGARLKQDSQSSTDLKTGFQGSSQAVQKPSQLLRPLPNDYYIPTTYPYTHDHIDELGEWPQRLLHVPTRTSCEWQPGNVYHGHANPAYRAITYTWGRWKLADGQQPAVGPVLDIDVPWEVPRVDPSHFTSATLWQVIRKICESVDPENSMPAVDFLWIDIACIDQRRGPLAALEVGRQAAIFSNAAGVAVWLSRTGGDESSRQFIQESLSKGELFRIESDLDWAEQPWDSEPPLPPPSLRADLLSCLRELTSDAWFSSLWTLQEGFLAGKGLIKHSISSSGYADYLVVEPSFFVFAAGDILELSPLPVRDECTFITLSSLARLFGEMLHRASHVPDGVKVSTETKFVEAFAEQLRSLLEKSGLLAMTTSGNPLNLLGFARFRTTTEDEDRIYATMQVFEYQLGTSRPGIDPRTWFNRADLEDQLGEALLLDRPVPSQLFRHLKPAEQGKGWRISESTEVPAAYRPYLQYEGRKPAFDKTSFRDQCELTTEVIGSKRYGHFTGKVCQFAQFNEQAQRLRRKTSDGLDHSLYPCTYYPDASEFLTGSGPYEALLKRGFPDDLDVQLAFGEYVKEMFRGNYLIVMYLGHKAGRYFGMLLLYVERNEGGERIVYWHRLGTVVWNYHKDIQEMMTFRTWQNSLSGEAYTYPTNVTCFSRALSQFGIKDGKAVPQIIYYQPGVGTGVGDKISGGVYGAGLSANVRAAYGFLAHNYNPGDQIYFFGFSRGAYTARAIAGLVTSFGLLTKRGMDNFSAVYQEYYEKQDKSQGPDLDQLVKVAGGKDNIHEDADKSVQIIGVWETVDFHKASGSGEKFEFYSNKLSEKVKYGFHALALDENRDAFLPTLWESNVKLPGGTNAKQVWFSGVHSEVGGGDADSGLADISLAWMIAECHKTGLLSFVDIDASPGDSSADWYLCRGGISDATTPRTTTAGSKWTTADYPKQGQAGHGLSLGGLEKLAESSFWRVSNLVLPAPTGKRTPNAKALPPDETNERIHQSIRDRRLDKAWPCAPVKGKSDADKLWKLAKPDDANNCIEETEPDAIELAFKGRIRFG